MNYKRKARVPGRKGYKNPILSPKAKPGRIGSVGRVGRVGRVG
jgi:hypothetical protein